MELVWGLTVTEATGANTVTWALPLIPSLVAVIVTGPPGLIALTIPLGETLAIPELLEAHATRRSFRTFSAESLTVEDSCSSAPTNIVAVAGITLTLATGGGTSSTP
jgi:hypothetical protein